MHSLSKLSRFRVSHHFKSQGSDPAHSVPLSEDLMGKVRPVDRLGRSTGLRVLLSGGERGGKINSQIIVCLGAKKNFVYKYLFIILYSAIFVKITLYSKYIHLMLQIFKVSFRFIFFIQFMIIFNESLTCFSI